MPKRINMGYVCINCGREIAQELLHVVECSGAVYCDECKETRGCVDGDAESGEPYEGEWPNV